MKHIDDMHSEDHSTFLIFDTIRSFVRSSCIMLMSRKHWNRSVVRVFSCLALAHGVIKKCVGICVFVLGTIHLGLHRPIWKSFRKYVILHYSADVFGPSNFEDGLCTEYTLILSSFHLWHDFVFIKISNFFISKCSSNGSFETIKKNVFLSAFHIPKWIEVDQLNIFHCDVLDS